MWHRTQEIPHYTYASVCIAIGMNSGGSCCVYPSIMYDNRRLFSLIEKVSLTVLVMTSMSFQFQRNPIER